MPHRLLRLAAGLGLLALAAGPSSARPVPTSPVGVHAPDECEDCRGTKVCRSHRAAETKALKALQSRLTSKDAKVRADALDAVAELGEAHENVPSQALSEVIAKGLEDKNLGVQLRAMELLADGQHPETAVKAVVARLGWYEKNMWSLVATMTGPKEVHGTVAEAMELLEESARTAEGLRDDRIVKALAKLLRSYPAEMRGEPVAMATSDALLSLGTRDAIAAVIDQLGRGAMKDDKRRRIHMALRRAAGRADIEESPSFDGAKLDARWSAWLRSHGRSFPAKLGKWRGPVEDESDERG